MYIVGCSVATLLVLFALTALLFPITQLGQLVIRRMRFLRNQLGSIWMSGALIGICMFGLGVYYGMPR